MAAIFSTPFLAMFDVLRILAMVACGVVVVTTPRVLVERGMYWPQRLRFIGLAAICIAIIGANMTNLGQAPSSPWRTSFIGVGAILAAVGVVAFLVRQDDEANDPPPARIVDMLAHAPVVVVIADSQSRILTVSGDSRRIIGWPSGSLVGHPLATMIPQRYLSAHLAAIDQVAATGRTSTPGQVMDIEVRGRDNNERRVKLAVFPLEPSDKGGLPRFIGVIRPPGNE